MIGANHCGHIPVSTRPWCITFKGSSGFHGFFQKLAKFLPLKRSSSLRNLCIDLDDQQKLNCKHPFRLAFHELYNYPLKVTVYMVLGICISIGSNSVIDLSCPLQRSC